MNSYELEPLEINLSVPNGTYEVTVNIKAHSDTVFDICSQYRTIIERDYKIKLGEEYEKSFIVNVCDKQADETEYENVSGIKIQILSDGDLTATAMASYIFDCSANERIDMTKVE